MNNVLQHWGVPGMHWGQRKSSSSSSSSQDHRVSRALKKKKLHEMSNAEIQALTTRMQLERQYKALNPGKIKRGQVKVKHVLALIGAATTAYKFVNRTLDDKQKMDKITTIVAKGIAASKTLKK